MLIIKIWICTDRDIIKENLFSLRLYISCDTNDEIKFLASFFMKKTRISVFRYIKFRYSEKATIFFLNLPLVLSLFNNYFLKKKWEIFSTLSILSDINDSKIKSHSNSWQQINEFEKLHKQLVLSKKASS